MDTVRWNIDVSPDTDKSLRKFLALQGMSEQSGEKSNFIEQAVRARILELTAEQAKMITDTVDPNELDSVINQAVEWARKR